jgi:hypothetical protein
MQPVEESKKVHLERYIKFINTRSEKNINIDDFEYNIHHIYPKSIAAKNGIEDFNGDWNLIKLTHREHFIAHLILWKCGYKEMTHAFYYMANNPQMKYKRLNSRQYEILEKEYLINMSEDFKNRIWINNGNEERFFDSTFIMPEGFVLGRLSRGAWFNNGKQERWLMDENIPEGFVKGRIKGFNKGKVWIYNGKEKRMIPKEQEIPEGFKLGAGFKPKSYSFITNGKETKYLYDGDILEDGWKKGSLNKGGKDLVWFNNGENNIKVRKELAPPGYVPGKLVKGFFITNGKEAKLTTNENIPEGWRKGRIKRTREQIRNSLTINI